MGAKTVFDLITHIFLFFPLFIILKFTKPLAQKKLINKHSILFMITVLLLFVSFLHHSFPDLIWMQAVDEFFVGLSIVYVFYVYVDNIDLHNYKWIILISLAFVAYLVCVGIDVSDEINDNTNRFATIICTAVLTAIAIGIFCCNWQDIYNAHEPNQREDYTYLGTSVFFAILAAVMFIINDVAEQFHLHSLWHLFAFISFGYLVLFAVSPKIENKEKAKKTIMAMNYVLSLSVRLLLFGYYGYVASLNEIPIGWSIFAFVWGGVIFVYGLIWAFRNFQNSDNIWLGMRLILHGGIWILVGACLNLKAPVWGIIGLLVGDFIISIIFSWEKIMGYWDTLKQTISSNVPPQKYKPLEFKKRYPVLQF